MPALQSGTPRRPLRAGSQARPPSPYHDVRFAKRPPHAPRMSDAAGQTLKLSLGIYLTTISTRLLLARPSGVWLVATGELSPFPTALIWLEGTPRLTK